VEYMSRHRARRHQVNLLLLDEADSNKRHYVLINNISRLLGHRTNTMVKHMYAIHASTLSPTPVHLTNIHHIALCMMRNKSCIRIQKTKMTVL